MTLDSGNLTYTPRLQGTPRIMRFMRIFEGVPWRRGVTQQWGNRKRGFRAFGRYVFGTLGNEANIIIRV